MFFFCYIEDVKNQNTFTDYNCSIRLLLFHRQLWFTLCSKLNDCNLFVKPSNFPKINTHQYNITHIATSSNCNSLPKLSHMLSHFYREKGNIIIFIMCFPFFHFSMLSTCFYRNSLPSFYSSVFIWLEKIIHIENYIQSSKYFLTFVYWKNRVSVNRFWNKLGEW